MPLKQHERGQVLVIVTLAFIVLIAFTALAIDGGSLYVDRRQAQAAGDTASMSAALAIMSGYSPSQVEQVALKKADDNGYKHAPPTTIVEVHWPPSPPHPYSGNTNYVQVIITNRVDTFFAHLFFPGPLQQTVQSVAHMSRNEDLLPGYAIYGNNPSACPAIEFDGTPDTLISGGGSILSNSLASCSCGTDGGAGVTRGSGSVTVDDPTAAGIYSAGCWGEYGSFTSSPTPSGGAGQEIIDPPPAPDCSALPDYRGEGDKVVTGTRTFSPGQYDSFWFTSASADVTLEPGIYCLDGEIDGISDSVAFQADAGAKIQGEDLMIYLSSSAGGLYAAGTTEIELAAGDPSDPDLPELFDASGEDWRGMLLYAHPDNHNEIHLSGSSNTMYTGTIFALGSHCTVQGTGDALALNSQLICDTIRITGTGDLTIDYDMSRNYQSDERIELFD